MASPPGDVGKTEQRRLSLKDKYIFCNVRLKRDFCKYIRVIHWPGLWSESFVQGLE